MKFLAGLCFLALSFSAMARERVSFFYSGVEGWGNSYYACDYVQDQTERVLEMFGATEVMVYCTGGIDMNRFPSPVSVQAYFELPVLNGSEIPQTLKFVGDSLSPNCGLNTTIVRSLLPKFTNVKVVKKSDACAFYSSNFSYEFLVTK